MSEGFAPLRNEDCLWPQWRVSPRVRAFVDWLAELFEHAGHVEADMSRVRQLMRGGLHTA